MTTALRWAVNALQGAAIVLWSLFWTPLALVAWAVTGGTDVPLAMARRIWAPGILTACGLRLSVRGLEHLEPNGCYLFAVNHQSQLDIPVVFRVLPMKLRFLVKAELRRVPLLSHYIRAMEMVFIDRRDRSRALKHMDRMTRKLREGCCFVTFPEGSRSRDSRVQPFKSGALLSALEAGVPVVPMAIEGADRVLAPGSLDLRSGRVRVAVGPPISVDGLTAAHRRAFTTRVEEEVRALYESLQSLSGASPS